MGVPTVTGQEVQSLAVWGIDQGVAAFTVTAIGVGLVTYAAIKAPRKTNRLSPIKLYQPDALQCRRTILMLVA